MIALTAGLPVLSSQLDLYYTRDALLENLPFLIFYGPSTTGNTTQNSSRVQSHIFSLAGHFSFPRLTIAPTSALYAAVNHLPADRQGEEVCRGLAVSLLSYFAALSKETKTSLRSIAGSRRPNGLAPMMFDEMHAGELAAKMEQLEVSGPILSYLNTAFTQQSVSWLDVDVSLPTGTMKRMTSIEDGDEVPTFDMNGLPLFHYGCYSSLINQLGIPVLLPTSKLKRAISRITAQNRTRILSKDAKISLRRELCEFVDTENTYLGKLNELVTKTATSFRELSGCKDVDSLFPESLDTIFKLSERFYGEIQSILENTEDEAIKDIEGLPTCEPRAGSNGDPTKAHDPTGAATFSLAMLLWFPKFLGPYQDYLRASTHFPKILGENLNDFSTPMSKKISDIGEQRLRSALIEPVQRLPRYSLLIDNMANLLPSSHPALHSLLKARDVITQICTLEATPDASNLSRTMSTIVQDWPASLPLAGRLIAAIDVMELDPPYDPASNGNPGIMLLFQDRLVLLDKLTSGALSARGVMAEVDRPTMQAQIDHYFAAERSEKTLAVSETFGLSSIQITTSNNGRLIRLTDLASIYPTMHSTTHFKVFCLQGPYESKAARIEEEVAKARIEGRYPETMRDGGKWALRSITCQSDLNVLLALSETCQGRSFGYQKSHSRILLSVGDAKPADSVSGANTIAHIEVTSSEMCRLELESSGERLKKIECRIDDVSSTLLHQLGEILVRENEKFTDCQISYYRTVLKSIPIDRHQTETKHHNHRPISPIKLLSKVFGGDNGLSRSPAKHTREAPMRHPGLTQPSPTKSRAILNDNSDLRDPGSKVTLLDANTANYKSSPSSLEDTFITYIVALRSRSGNVVGGVLRNRAAADELVVNELYNRLLEDPSRLHMATEASVDVLFAAFEKFLRVAWRERIGPLITPTAIQDLQASLDLGKPSTFAQDFKALLDEMPPQSRRCFAAMMKVLMELLDASGNDGDRGVLICSFTEALVLVGNPQEYVNLLDRLVDDYDNLFADAVEKPGSSGSATGSLTGSHSFVTGSVGSNTSSVRRKFGFGGLSRENSKSESESKVASIWRSMSKTAKNSGDSHSQSSSQPGSISKGSLVRSRSTDTASNMLLPRRPNSRDRPLTASSTLSDDTTSRPETSGNGVGSLSSIGEGMPHLANALSKKKRRSSLSDLIQVKDSSPLPFVSPLQPRKLPAKPSVTTSKTLPTTPSPRKPSRTNHLERPSPPESAIPSRIPYSQGRARSPLASASKENSPSPRAAQAKSPTRPFGDPHKRKTSRSNLPAPKTGGLSERVWPPNGNETSPKKSTAPDSPPKKLRIQSPQKMRDRLSQEQSTFANDEINLQDEMNKIAKELSTFKLRSSTLKPPTSSSTSASSSSSTLASKAQQQTLSSLTTRLDHLSTSLQTFNTTHTSTLSSIHKTLETNLAHATTKARKLDELYREANAENEALYERFNHELEKVLARVRGGDGVKEMRSRLAGALREVEGLRAERATLRREVAGLKSLTK